MFHLSSVEALSHEDLKKTFNFLAEQTSHHVPGVVSIKGNHPGEKTVISFMTHGNEVSGLAVARYLLGNRSSIEDCLQGEILLTLNNVEAGRRYFMAANGTEKREARKRDIDMNRLPEDIFDRSGSGNSYEIQRVLELYPFWKDATSGLDLHSTLLPSDPIVVDIKGEPAVLDNLSDGIVLEKRIENIVPIQQGYPVSFLYGGLENNIPVLEIESGCHEDPQTQLTAIRSTISFLIKLGMLEVEITEQPSIQEIYRVIGAVVFPNLSYKLEKLHPMFGPLRQGEILATGDGEPIVAPVDGHALFCTDKLRVDDPKKLATERLFLAEKMRQRRRTLILPVL